MSSDLKKKVAIGLGAVAVLVGGLFLKNFLSEKSMKALDKKEVVHILKVYRKERYVLFKQIATFAINIMQQMRGNINQPTIEQFINGPECPIKLKEESEQILDNVCRQNNTTVDTLAFSLEQLNEDPQIVQLQQQQEVDYKASISGKLPQFDPKVPASLTKDKFYQLQNRITKATYMHQVQVFKKLQEHSEIEIQQNPDILKELGSPDAKNEEMLRSEGLGSEYEPATAILDAGSMQYRNHADFRAKIQQIEKGYQTILMKYLQRIQTKTVTDAELNQMEEEIIYYEPL